MYEGRERAKERLREKRIKLMGLYENTPKQEDKVTRQRLRKFARDKAKQEASSLAQKLRLGKRHKPAVATEKKEL